MRIIDETGVELTSPDLTEGYLTEEIIGSSYHYETVAEYPNGGKDVRKVLDSTETVQRYHRYTAAEKQMQQTITDLQLALCELYEKEES